MGDVYYKCFRYSLTGSPLIPAPPTAPLGPILPCSSTTCSQFYIFFTCWNTDSTQSLFTYNFSFGASESLRPLFSCITLEKSDKTQTAIHWWDQRFILAADYNRTVSLSRVFHKQRETHCLSDDAYDARAASESWQALEKHKRWGQRELLVHKLSELLLKRSWATNF